MSDIWSLPLVKDRSSGVFPLASFASTGAPYFSRLLAAYEHRVNVRLEIAYMLDMYDSQMLAKPELFHKIGKEGIMEYVKIQMCVEV